MHQALLTQEIVCMIMQNIHGLKETMTFYNAALTCSSFLEPALDELWHDMESITPLFKLISKFQDQHGIIWGPIPESDLITFNKYASRVRSYCWQGLDDVDISAFIHVLRVCGRSYIFPNLVNLSIPWYFEGNFDSRIMFLMSPRLRDFRMSAIDNPVSLTVSILNSLQISAPNISHLVLSCKVFDDRCISALCSLSRLQEITLKDDRSGTTPTFDLSFFPRLSCKEVLQEFTLDGLHIIWSAGSLDCGTVEFPLLKYINFRLCFSMGPIAKLFHYAMVPSLKGIDTRFGPSPSKLVNAVEAPYWHQFFDRIGRATSDHFKYLGIMLDNFHPPGETREQWEHVGLRVSNFPNFNIPSLETLTITLPFLCSLDRNDLKKLLFSVRASQALI